MHVLSSCDVWEPQPRVALALLVREDIVRVSESRAVGGMVGPRPHEFYSNSRGEMQKQRANTWHRHWIFPCGPDLTTLPRLEALQWPVGWERKLSSEPMWILEAVRGRDVESGKWSVMSLGLFPSNSVFLRLCSHDGSMKV